MNTSENLRQQRIEIEKQERLRRNSVAFIIGRGENEGAHRTISGLYIDATEIPPELSKKTISELCTQGSRSEVERLQIVETEQTEKTPQGAKPITKPQLIQDLVGKGVKEDNAALLAEQLTVNLMFSFKDVSHGIKYTHIGLVIRPVNENENEPIAQSSSVQFGIFIVPTQPRKPQ